MVPGLVDFGQNWVQVFAVEYLGCGGSGVERSGGLGRWRLGEFCGGVWDGSVDSGVANLEVEGRWVL